MQASMLVVLVVIVGTISQGVSALSPTVTVDCKGRGDYTTVKAGIAGLVSKKKSVSGKAVLYIKNCIYKEKVQIPSTLSNTVIKGESATGVVITYGDTARKSGSTAKSATVKISASDIVIIDVSFVNSAGPHDHDINDLQGVALHIVGDRMAFFGCRMLGFQDTLFDEMGRHYFKNCYIEGAIDFIFGNGQSIYEGCTINAPWVGSYTAQNRPSSSQKTGFVFWKSTLKGNQAMTLNRAWGSASRVVYVQCVFDVVINKRKAYSDFGVSSRRNTVYYGEYATTGKGASSSKRADWKGVYVLGASEASKFATYEFINGASWLSTSPPVVTV